MARTTGIVILAAGLGTRMKTPDKAKVMHEICGRPMIEYVVRTATLVAGANVVVVVGHQADTIKKTASAAGPCLFAYQEKQLGTGHAVLCALPHIPADIKQIVILCGDVPLIRPSTIERLVNAHEQQGREISVLAVTVENPTGYGRMVQDDDGNLTAIVEEADTDIDQKSINMINTGIYVVDKAYLESALPQVRADNAQNEIYLTDIVKLGYQEGKKIGVVIGDDSNEIIGVNSLVDLQVVENILKKTAIELS